MGCTATVLTKCNMSRVVRVEPGESKMIFNYTQKIFHVTVYIFTYIFKYVGFNSSNIS